MTRICVLATNLDGTGSEDDQSEIVAGDVYRQSAESPESPNSDTPPAGSNGKQLGR